MSTSAVSAFCQVDNTFIVKGVIVAFVAVEDVFAYIVGSTTDVAHRESIFAHRGGVSPSTALCVPRHECWPVKLFGLDVPG